MDAVGSTTSLPDPKYELSYPPLSVPIYTPLDRDLVLGDPVVDDAEGDVRRCFNCGSPAHPVADCPEPFNRALVALSRALFTFHHGEPTAPFQRVHDAEGSRRQRLAWLDTFEPGEVRGAVLRGALGLREGDKGERAEWLQNMACWGYPPGWVATRDPRERVWARIAGSAGGEDADEDVLFSIFGDEGEERCVLSCAAAARADAGTEDTFSSGDEEEGPLTRWAAFPNTYFLPSKLPIYNGLTLPALGSGARPAPVSTTYTPDRHELWQSISASQTAPAHITPARVPPWRLPGAFGANTSSLFAPLPPPLFPAPPPALPPPPLPSAPRLPPLRVAEDTESDDDMDLSE